MPACDVTQLCLQACICSDVCLLSNMHSRKPENILRLSCLSISSLTFGTDLTLLDDDPVLAQGSRPSETFVSPQHAKIDLSAGFESSRFDYCN